MLSRILGGLVGAIGILLLAALALGNVLIDIFSVVLCVVSQVIAFRLYRHARRLRAEKLDI